MNRDLLNRLDEQLSELKYMAEFASDLCDRLDGSDESLPGYFRISTDDGNRLAFCSIDILKRVRILMETLTEGAYQSLAREGAIRHTGD